jgi:DNA mismatch endonuclease (patch repair protein)
MQANRRISRVEIDFRKRLWHAGLRGYRITLPIPGRPDVAYPGLRLAIFLNGCFWHRCPECARRTPRTNGSYWAEKLDRNAARDALVIRLLKDMGWTSMTIWEHEVRRSPEQAIAHVADVIAVRRRALMRPDD